ncbi:nucleotidyltransferase family protein [Pseudomonas aegrilactucae]|uniref:Nucleotidyltransferase family protein n=1 Tax=Pseudomonas aegrilactucae TaxID=2854028 RepID=A0A9Q2XGW7_9PSED|nr:nucleotidyltransferase family protein [Pseudomonas aegrilactucae]MBV6285942.1 nucleotidyltransferase family protein [Pseudomonas aegrilactucae]
MKPLDQQLWRNVLLAQGSSIQQAISNLDASGLQITLVVCPEGRLQGSVTDGDVRRGLLRGLNLDSPVEQIMALSPLVVPPDMARELVLDLMHANKIHQLPIVDSERHVIGLHLWDEVLEPVDREHTMVIMAGGLGKRLLPLTEDCPKPMLPVGGKPILELIIERAKADGFVNFIVSVHYLGHMIEDYFGDGHKWGVKIAYLHEDSPLGTAGAISLLAPRPTLPFVVTNGDVLTDIRYGEMLDFHLRHGAMATMAVRLHEWQNPFGVIRTDGIKIVGFDEKPIYRTHVNAGIYVLAPAVLDELVVGGQCDMPTLFERVQQKGASTIAYPMHEPWLDVGRPDDLQLARNKYPV